MSVLTWHLLLYHWYNWKCCEWNQTSFTDLSQKHYIGLKIMSNNRLEWSWPEYVAGWLLELLSYNTACQTWRWAKSLPALLLSTRGRLLCWPCTSLASASSLWLWLLLLPSSSFLLMNIFLAAHTRTDIRLKEKKVRGIPTEVIPESNTKRSVVMKTGLAADLGEERKRIGYVLC